jgi:hypothetical protein
MGLFDKTATATAGQDPGDTSTSGLGSLISTSDLFKKAVAEGTINPSAAIGNQDYLDRILTEAGPRTLTLDPGAFVDTRDNRYVQDAYNYYLGGGFPTVDVAQDTAQIPGAIDTLVDTGGSGGGIGQDQVTGGGGTTPTGGLTESGTFGGQPTFTTTPGTTVDNVTGDITNPDGSFGGNIVDEFATLPSGNIVDEVALTGGIPDTNITAPSGDVFAAGDPLAEEKIDFDAPATELGSQINSAFENVKDQGIGAIESFKDTLVGLGGTIKEGFDNVVDFGGTQIDAGKTLATGAINYLGKSIFGPVGAVLGTALGAIQSDPIDAATKEGLEDKGYEFDDIGRLTTGPMAGYAVESVFGDGIADATLDRIDSIENRNAPQTEASIKKVEELYDFLGDITEVKAQEFGPQEDIGAISGDMNTGADPVSGDLPGGGNIMDEFEPSDIQATDPSLDIPDRQRGDSGQETGPTSTDPADDFDDGTMTGVAADTTGDPIGGFFDAVDSAAGGGGTPSGGLTDAQAEANQDAARGGNTGSTGMSDAQAAANRDAARGGGGGSSGGGKIVCTMMNESYGFGSFRNKIWLRHSKDLAHEYQKGYHKIFLPLVKLSKNNKVLKTMLEHIAVHRTIDIRQESRGKVHLLGRVYRKILEPICYLVGKYVK